MSTTIYSGEIKMRYRLLSFALIGLSVCLTPTSEAQRKLKIYISADMEGVVGVVTADQLGPQGFEYNRFREFMTEEVKAAVEAAFEAGGPGSRGREPHR